jgi:iron complex transport system substrate-binding protein
MKAGCRFFGLAPRSLSDLFGDIVAIGRLMGAELRALNVVAGMKAEIEKIRSKTSARNRARVFCEEWGKPIIASQHWVEELIEAAGGQFLGEPGKPVAAEQILAQDPEVVIAAWCGAGDRVPLEKIVKQRGWENMKAVKDGRVYCIRDEYLNTPASTLIGGLRALAWAIHPELFPRPEGIRQMQPDRECSPEIETKHLV